jgi:hypothetical protein
MLHLHLFLVPNMLCRSTMLQVPLMAQPLASILGPNNSRHMNMQEWVH